MGGNKPADVSFRGISPRLFKRELVLYERSRQSTGLTIKTEGRPTISGLGLAFLTSSQLMMYLSNSPLMKTSLRLCDSQLRRRPFVVSAAPFETA